ncbi:hypothetical protein LR48_Vigan10g192600 [Vigna angularis]|uniref:Uncharacterized protein n=1 Tax=Phaseolus angularis TaxID=3914 RepID=A0A0L9VMT5_PHAAN|nr:hypothetical protein LR48_Vigan10g192600 [Vigna angularis]
MEATADWRRRASSLVASPASFKLQPPLSFPVQQPPSVQHVGEDVCREEESPKLEGAHEI